MSSAIKKRRMPDTLHFRAEELLINHESVHQVWRQLQISKPYIQDLRDKLIQEGRLIPPKPLQYRGTIKFAS